jgi:transcriptional regulator with PAS, ATPase and Fis domain
MISPVLATPSLSSPYVSEGFLTNDSATLKTLKRVDACIQQQSDVVWIEGESGTGKTLLARIIAKKQAESQRKTYHTGHFSLPDMDIDRLMTQGFDALCIHIAPTTKLTHIRHFQQQLTLHSRIRNVKLQLLCFMTLPCHRYTPQVARQLNVMKHVFIEHYYEYIMLQPLKQRTQDVSLLATFFLQQLDQIVQKDSAEKLLLNIERVRSITAMDFPDNIWGLQRICLQFLQYETPSFNVRQLTPATNDPTLKSRDSTIDLCDAEGNLRIYDDLEREIYAHACLYHRGCKSAAARDLHVGRTTLYRKLQSK